MKLALAQVNPTVGAIETNVAMIRRAVAEAVARGAECVVLPELAVCGYPPRDLVLSAAFVGACEAAVQELAKVVEASCTVIVGSPRAMSSGGVANALAVLRGGTITQWYDKRLLPTYDVFDEDRYFRPGDQPVVIDVPSVSGSVRVGLSICEDLWKGQEHGFNWRYDGRPDPVPELVAQGATIIVNPSASPFGLGKGARHREIMRMHAMRHGVMVAAVNQVGANDELIFDGHAAVMDAAGRLVCAGPGFVEAITIFDSAAKHETVTDPIAAEDCQMAFHALSLGIRDYLHKTGFAKVIIGLSGGIDSALTAVLAVHALGAANVLGVALPGPYSSEHSKSDAYDLAKRLGIACPTISISEPVEAFANVINPVFLQQKQPELGATLPDLAEENLQSRCRGTTLMALSNRLGAMVLTTGNKSEMAVGYCTLYGDMNGGLAVLSDVPKTLVYAISRWVNQEWKACGFGCEPIPQASIEKAPSAELRPNQTDQDSLPEYEVLDRVIQARVEERQSVDEIVASTGFEHALVARVCRMIDIAEYKRRQAAVGLKITSVAFGSGRRMPIAQKWRG